MGVRCLPPTVRRYVQTPAAARRVPGFPPALFDGTSEAWFDSLQDARALADDPGMEPITNDMPTFLAGAWSVTLLGAEDRRLVRREPGIGFQAKALILLARTPTLSVEEFREQWAELPDPRHDGLLRYVRCPVDEATGPFGYDGVAEYAFADMWALDDAFTGSQLRKHLDALHSLLDGQRTTAFAGHEIAMGQPASTAGGPGVCAVHPDAPEADR
jgi:hypothetical protein